jgi:uncharacterized YigZ family protein
MSLIIDSYKTLSAPSTGDFKDRGSKFLAYAYPVLSEEDCFSYLEVIKKEHFKCNHHCYAWRIGIEGNRFRANDDGEPSGTAGRPILGQIDSFGLTNTFVVVARYFGGTLLGASGLINAYREGAAEALRNANIVEKIIKDYFLLDFDYALMPDVMNAVKKIDLEIIEQTYGDRGAIKIAIRKSETESTLLTFKALVLKVSKEEALVSDYPDGLLKVVPIV